MRAWTRRSTGSQANFRDLEDAMLVQVQLEKRMSARIKEHAEWIVQHEEALRQHKEWLSGVDDKVNLLIQREMRREGGPESRT